MNNFNYIKNAVAGVIITAVCIAAIFSVTAMFSPDAPTETLKDQTAVIVTCFFDTILSLLAAVGAVVTAQNLFGMYAEKTGLEKHAGALKALAITKILLTLSIQLVFWSAFTVIGSLAAMPFLFPPEANVEGGDSVTVVVLGWIFIAASLGAAAFSVVKAVKQIKTAIESYTFDKYALPPEEKPEQSESDNDDINSD